MEIHISTGIYIRSDRKHQPCVHRQSIELIPGPESRREHNRYNDSYGWLSDKGKFYPCKWNELEKWADKRLESYYGDKTGPNIPGAVWLITVERWIAITSPYHGIPWHRYDASQQMKPAQIEFLCKFYREHDRKDTADELAATLAL